MKFIPLTLLLLFTCSFPAHSVLIQYKYDNLSQLSKAEYSTGTTFHYTYDHIGNREHASVSKNVFVLGDIDGNSAIDLTDLILGLQICSGESPSSITLQSDINANSQIDMAEVLYIMQQLML